MNATIHHGDILAWAAAYDGEPFHALLCDPPYHLTDPRDPARAAAKSPEARKARGFMQMKWDGGDIAFRPETWHAVGRLLYPGAFGMAFAGSRGWHRMACAIEDAGLIIHPTVFAWNYLSGFPKATRLDHKGGAIWEGHRYGLQAMKPAIEPIIVFQRPYAGRPVDSITATGAGAINVDGGRIAAEGKTRFPVGTQKTGYSGGFPLNSDNPDPAGRWPANFALSHHPACADVCHPDCAVRRLGEQSGERRASNSGPGEGYTVQGVTYGNSTFNSTRGQDYGDTGTAARMFLNADWAAERIEAADGVGYFAKASSAEREAGLDPLQVALMAQLYGEFDETTVGDGRKTPIDNPYQRGETGRRNTHPTIKPLSLARWLATLLLPPAPYAPRRLLVPFAGAGSEMIGAMLAGWEYVEGVELDAEHVRIARTRLAYWQARRHEFAAGQPITVTAAPKAPDGQSTIFDALEVA